jgi:hypothetical protein
MKPFQKPAPTKAEREGRRPEGNTVKLKFDEDYGYWVWIKGDGTRYRATDLPWPNDARYSYDRRPGEPKEDPEFEPYPLQHLAAALRCSNTDVLEIIGRHGEFYRKRKRQ